MLDLPHAISEELLNHTMLDGAGFVATTLSVWLGHIRVKNKMWDNTADAGKRGQIYFLPRHLRLTPGILKNKFASLFL